MTTQAIGSTRHLLPEMQQTVQAGRVQGIWRLMREFRLPYIGAAISLGVANTARTGSLFLIRYFIDTYLGESDYSYALWMIVAAFIGLAAIQGAFTFVSGSLAARTAEGIAEKLRNFLLDHIQRLPYSYHDTMQTGELIQRVTSDVDALRRFFASQAIESSRIIFLFVINFVAIAMLHLQLALISVIVVPIILALSVFFFRLVSAAYEDYQSQEAVLTTTLQENLTGVRVVKAFARQKFEEDKFEDANHAKYVKGLRLLLMHSLYWPISDLLCAIQMLAGYTIGALYAINGQITVGTYLAYTGMVLLIIWPMRNLGRLVVDMSRGLVSFERVAEVIRVQRETMEEVDVEMPERLRGEIEMRKVGFTYGQTLQNGTDANEKISTAPPVAMAHTEDEHQPARDWLIALQNVSFHALPGQRIALLGATGAGKTTLINLLPRFYDYTEGRILLDGIDLRKYSRSYLRSQIGIVEQEPFLFSRTVRDNITYSVGRDVSQSEIESAARAAAIHDVIMTKLPQQYDTLIGERGTTLSGGQKQRVAIARTLLKDPKILILDDSTSSVDMETEALIRQALEALMVNRTTFIIAHRIQTVMNADQILVLNRGEIIQAGTHEELAGKEGMYRRIYLAQTRIEDELEKELNSV